MAELILQALEYSQTFEVAQMALQEQLPLGSFSMAEANLSNYSPQHMFTRYFTTSKCTSKGNPSSQEDVF